MLIRRLIAALLPANAPSDDNDLHLPRPGESRPRGHFREFTASRRLQRGGMTLGATRRNRTGHCGGIIPVAGEKIP